MKKITIVTVLAFATVLCGLAYGGEGRVPSEDGIEIAYEVGGAGEPALVFVHGWCCDRSYWREQMEHFSKKHRVVAVDLAGHGESGMERKTYTVEAFGRDVAAVVEELGLEEVVLVGHSMGGPVSLEAARLLGGRLIGIVGIDTYQSLGRRLDEEQVQAMLAPIERDFAGTTRMFVRSMFAPGTDPALVDLIADDMASAPPEVGLGAFRETLRYDPAAALGEIGADIIAINSDRLPTDIEGNRGVARSFDVKLVPGVGHFMMLEAPERFNGLLGEVIDELTAAGR